MLWKVLNGFSQAIIIVLALVLITTITTKHSSNAALEDFQKRVDERFKADTIAYTEKIKTVEDNLNRYQQLRESRAQLYSQRLDELYDLYKKDPAPIKTTKCTPVAQQENPVTKNFSYLENKINKVDEKVDTEGNRLLQRVSILEQRVNVLNSSKSDNVKVIQTNLQTVHTDNNK